MRSTRYLKYFISVLFVSLVTMGALYAGVVNLDINAKSISADTKALNPKIILIRKGQASFGVFSTITQPQTFKLKVSGLADKEYDAYLNKNYIGKYTMQALNEGVDFQLEGRVVDENLIRCLDSIKDKVEAEYRRLSDVQTKEAQRVATNLGQAYDWVNSGLDADRKFRSAQILLAPAGEILQRMPALTRHNAEETARGITRACWSLQLARGVMFREIKDLVLRNTAIAAMTPVDFKAVYSVKNGKPHIDAVLTNNCDLAISGNISLGLPKGWKTNAKTLEISDLKSGNKLSFEIDLIAPAKGAVAPESVPIAANVTLTQDNATADLKLKVIAANTPIDGAK